MAVHDPPLNLPFVDESLYVARPWVEWLIYTRSNFVEIEENVDEIEVTIAQIAINTANIATNTANISTNASNIASNTSNILSNEAMSYYFASL